MPVVVSLPHVFMVIADGAERDIRPVALVFQLHTSRRTLHVFMVIVDDGAEHPPVTCVQSLLSFIFTVHAALCMCLCILSP